MLRKICPKCLKNPTFENGNFCFECLALNEALIDATGSLITPEIQTAQNQKAQWVANQLGILRRELHLFCFNLEESGNGDPDATQIFQQLKEMGYDFNDWGWDNDGPPMPEEWGKDPEPDKFITETWYGNIRKSILKYKYTQPI